MTNVSPTTSPPSRSTSRAVAAAVPPVAITSSTISTRSPGAIASRWISSRSVPYSSSYSSRSISHGSLPGLAHRDEPGDVAVRDRRREHEAAGLDPEHLVDVLVGEGRRDGVDRRGEGVGRGEQRRDVAEDDPRLRIVGDVAHMRLQPGGIHCPPGYRRRSRRYLRFRPRCWRARGWIGPRGTAGGPGTPIGTASAAAPSIAARRARTTGTPTDADAAAAETRARRSLGERAVLRLPFLPPREQRRGDEDRRVRTDEQTGREREGEVLERGRAEDAGADDQQRHAPAAARRATSTATASAPGSATC